MHVHTYVRHTYVRHTYTSYICTSYIYFKHIMSNGQHLVQECQWRWRIAKISADFCVWEIVLQARKERERVDYYVSICLTSAIFRLSGHQRENCSLNQNKHELEEKNRRGNRWEWFKVKKDRQIKESKEPICWYRKSVSNVVYNEIMVFASILILRIFSIKGQTSFGHF